jgi:hypothetical protein
MSTNKHRRTGVFFFWIGVAMSAACVAVVLARDHDLLRQFEQKGFPLSGVFAVAAALTFLVTELCDSLYGPGKAKDQNSLPSHRPSHRMHTNQNGKLPEQEFMGFMEPDFNRLHEAKSGELDVKELRP